jgi:hypothetical protein
LSDNAKEKRNKPERARLPIAMVILIYIRQRGTFISRSALAEHDVTLSNM